MNLAPRILRALSMPINDWPIRQFNLLVLSVQLALILFLGLSALGIHLTVLQIIVGFVYLTFIPGFLILRIMRVHHINNTEAVLYAVGLSLSFLLLVGLLINSGYPLVGIAQPLSGISLNMSLISVTLILTLICRISDPGYPVKKATTYESLPITGILIILMLPILSIAGVLLFNHSQNNIILLIMIPLLAMVVLIAAMGKIITRDLFAFTIFIIALSLLLHRTLVTENLLGWDIRLEYLIYKVTDQSGFWDSTAGFINYASSLTIAVLPTIYCKFMDITGVWFFKMIYPLIFSLVPAAAYAIYRKFMAPANALLAAFFLIAFPSFFITGTELAKQGFALLFMILFVLIMADSKMKQNRILIAIIFMASLVFSHYGASYLWFIYLSIVLVIQLILTRLNITYNSEYAGKAVTTALSPANTITIGIFTLFIILNYLWYVSVSQGVMFSSVILWGRDIYSHLDDFLNPASTDMNVLKQIGFADISSRSWQYALAAGISWFTRIILVLGFVAMVATLARRKVSSYSPVLLAISFAGMISLLLTFIPYLTTGGFSSERIYFISLLFISPFFVLGFDFLFGWLKKWYLSNTVNNISRATMLTILMIYYLFQVGWVFQVTGAEPSSFSLSNKVDHARFSKGEEVSAQWLTSNIGAYSSAVYADKIGGVVFRAYPGSLHSEVLGGMNFAKTLSEFSNYSRNIVIPRDSYIFLRK